MSLTVGRRYRFAAAHRLDHPALSAAENEHLFGICHRPHGHDYALTVRVRGQADPVTGAVVDTPALDAAVTGILAEVTHRRLESDVAALSGAPATTERLIAYLHTRLAPLLSDLGATLVGLDLAETRNNRFETESR